MCVCVCVCVRVRVRVCVCLLFNQSMACVALFKDVCLHHLIREEDRPYAEEIAKCEKRICSEPPEPRHFSCD